MQKSWRPFLVVTLKTQVFAVTAQNTLQHFQGASALETFHFFEGAPVFVEGGACAMAQWHNGQSKSAEVRSDRIAVTCDAEDGCLVVEIHIDLFNSY